MICRIADSKVPEWLMPIQKMNEAIYKPHT
jgi:hypothetical protein